MNYVYQIPITLTTSVIIGTGKPFILEIYFGNKRLLLSAKHVDLVYCLKNLTYTNLNISML